MKCEAEGIIQYALPIKRGTSRKGNDYEIRDYVMETSTWYHTRMRFSVFSFDGPVENPPQVGDKIKLRFEVLAAQSKDGNWYNSVKALSIDKIEDDHGSDKQD